MPPCVIHVDNIVHRILLEILPWLTYQPLQSIFPLLHGFLLRTLPYIYMNFMFFCGKAKQNLVLIWSYFKSTTTQCTSRFAHLLLDLVVFGINKKKLRVLFLAPSFRKIIYQKLSVLSPHLLKASNFRHYSSWLFDCQKPVFWVGRQEKGPSEEGPSTWNRSRTSFNPRGMSEMAGIFFSFP